MKKFIGGALALIVVVGLGAAFFVWQASRGLAPEALETQYASADDRFLMIDGARVRVREEGPADAPPILLIHGFTFSLESWDAWAASLSDDHRVIRYDLLGHGLTGPDPQQRYAPQERAAFVGSVLDALDIDSAVIAGSSLGGLAAWRFAAENPDRVDALILVASGGFSMNGVTDKPAPLPPAMKLFLQTAPEAGVSAMFETVYGDAQPSPERVALARDMMRRRGNGEAFVQSIAEFTLPDPEADLARVTAPTLLLWGALDALIPPDHGRRFETAMPNAELIVYDRVGHVPHEEAPALTLGDARAFLSGLEASE
ncbi:MAG: alpha/beta hydrolase [Pseudomonadota bacterium]